MKVQAQVQTVERIGIDPNEESEFGLAVTPEAFEILSSGIYTDPITAVIRELSCNAYDSNVAVGKKDEPFEIHLPNQLEPWFSVKDNGLGLSDDQVRGKKNPKTGKRENGLFITYFASTKREDTEQVLANDQIGAKGLGSKSPYAYSDAFEVVTRYGGVRRTYSVFKNEKLIPTIVILHEADTDECNGVEVKLAIRSNDFQSFADKAAEALKHFPVQPEVKGRARFEFNKLPADRFEGDGYYTSNGYRYDSDKFTAVMGHVPYRVDISKITGRLGVRDCEFLDSYKITAFFPIGTLETAASREEVRYDDRSSENLCDAIRKARTDFIEKTDEEMVTLTKDIDDRWEAYRILNDKFESVSSLTSIAGDYEWTADVVNEWIENSGKYDFMTPDYHTVVCYTSGRTRALRKKDYTANSVPHTATIMPSMYQPVVILMDVRVRSSLRLNQYLADVDDSHKPIMAITQTREKIILERDPKLKKVNYTTDLKDLIDSLGNPKFIKLSEVTTDVKAVFKGKRTVGLTFNQFGAGQSPRNAHNRRPIFNIVAAPGEPEIDHQHLYMLVETTSKRMCLRNGSVLETWTHGRAKNRVSQMLDIINSVNKTKYKSNEVFGLTKKVVKSVKDNADWTNIFDLFEESAAEMEDMYEYFANKNATSKEGGIKDMVFHYDFIDRVEDLEEDSFLRTTLLSHAEKNVEMKKELAHISEDQINTIRSLGNAVMFKGHEDQKDPTPLFDPQEILNYYPMLNLISYNIMSGGEKVFDYIALVDSQ
jgi:hypothetical protein